MKIALPGFEIDDDPARIDADAAWRFLSADAYWARWRRRQDFDRQVAAAWRLAGAYAMDGGGGASGSGSCEAGRMVGFARSTSDGVSLAYLADLFVLPEARGHGLGKALVELMVDTGPGADFRWMLHTSDAHGLYRQFGFTEPDRRYLERRERR